MGDERARAVVEPVMETIPQIELRQLRYELDLARRDAAAWKAIAEHGAPDLCARLKAATDVAVTYALRARGV